MATRLLTATGKLFALMAVACGLLGLLSVNAAKADPPPCNCGAPPTSSTSGSDGGDWLRFNQCYAFTCSSCQATCGSPKLPGDVGYDAWIACYNNGNCVALGCNVQTPQCAVQIIFQCRNRKCGLMSGACYCDHSQGNPLLPCLCL